MTKKELIHRISRECASSRLRRVAGKLPKARQRRARSRRAGSRKVTLRKAG